MTRWLRLSPLLFLPACELRSCAGSASAAGPASAPALAPPDRAGVPDPRLAGPAQPPRAEPPQSAPLPPASAAAEPPRPPQTVPPAPPRPGGDPLPAALEEARRRALGARAAAQAAPRPEGGPLFSAPMSELLGARHRRGALTLQADGTTFSVSAQPSRLGARPSTAFVVIQSRAGGPPALVDVRKLKHGGAISLISNLVAGGSVDEASAGGRRFGILLLPDASDGACRKPRSKIELWPHGRREQGRSWELYKLFDAASAAAPGFTAGPARIGVAVYEDAEGGRSVSFIAGEPVGGLRRIPLELLSRPDGKLVAFALRELPGKRFGARIAGEGERQTLEVHDLSAPSAGSPALVELDQLAPEDPC